MKTIVRLAGILLVLGLPAAAGAGEVDHSGYDALLKKHTHDGLVDYAAIKKDMSDLEAYLQALSDSSALHYDEWTRDARMAFWINAYNAATIYAVAAEYPVERGGSARDDGQGPDRVKRVEVLRDSMYIELAGRPVTLNEIEQKILREEFGDPRIHFALVPASLGGPRLSADAYSAEEIDAQLERDAVRFVNDPGKVRVNVTRGRLHVSEMFDWYAADFALGDGEIPGWLRAYRKKTRGFVKFIAERVDANTRAAIMKRSLKVDYTDYDWSLNHGVRAQNAQ